jgi:hypothetical protein
MAPHQDAGHRVHDHPKAGHCVQAGARLLNHLAPLLKFLAAGSTVTALAELGLPEHWKNDNSAQDDSPPKAVLKSAALQRMETMDGYFPNTMMDGNLPMEELMDVHFPNMVLMVSLRSLELMDAHFPNVALMVSLRSLELPPEYYWYDEELRWSRWQSSQGDAQEKIEMVARPMQETPMLSVAYPLLEGVREYAQGQANDVYQVVWYQYPGWLVQHLPVLDGREYGVWNWLFSAARSRQQRD